MNRDKLDEIEAGLRKRRDEIGRELERLTKPPNEGVSVGFGKRIGDGTTEAVERLATTATAKSLAGSIDDIDKALHHIETGTYGSCENCAEPIPPARLEALPASTRCVTCASSEQP